MRQTQKLYTKKNNIMSLSIKLINDEEHFVYEIFIQDNGVSPENV